MVGSVADRGGVKAQINVTPLVDVVLVLLIIFMVVTPMLSRGKAVQLPAASATDRAGAAEHALVLSLTADRQLWLENQRVEPSELSTLLEHKAREGSVLVRADASLSMHELRGLLLTLRHAGVQRIAFGVMQPKRGSP